MGVEQKFAWEVDKPEKAVQSLGVLQEVFGSHIALWVLFMELQAVILSSENLHFGDSWRHLSQAEFINFHPHITLSIPYLKEHHVPWTFCPSQDLGVRVVLSLFSPSLTGITYVLSSSWCCLLMLTAIVFNPSSLSAWVIVDPRLFSVFCFTCSSPFPTCRKHTLSKMQILPCAPYLQDKIKMSLLDHKAFQLLRHTLPPLCLPSHGFLSWEYLFCPPFTSQESQEAQLAFPTIYFIYLYDHG